MTVSQIPTSQELPYYSKKITLDGETFLFLFKWNVREEAWYLSIYREDETPIQVGRKIVVNWPLLRRLVSADAPLGSLSAYETTGSEEEPNFSELGTRVLLLYADEEEIVAIEEEAEAL